MNRFHIWLKQLLLWAAPLYPGILAVADLFGCAIDAIRFKSEAVCVDVGLALQLFGIFTVLYNILILRVELGRVPLRTSLFKWIKSFPPFPKPPTVIAGTARFGGTSSVCAVIDQVSVAPTSVEERLSELEKSLAGLRSEVVQMAAELKQKISFVQADVDRFRETSGHRQTELRESIEKTALMGAPIAAFGLLCLAFGLVMTTLAHQIVQWV